MAQRNAKVQRLLKIIFQNLSLIEMSPQIGEPVTLEMESFSDKII